MEQSRETLQDRIKRIQDRPLQELLRDITDSAMARQSVTTATKQDRWLIVGGQTVRGTTEQEKAPPTTGGQADAQGQAITPVTDSMPAHLASPNPHPQYLLQKDYTRANGVADVVGTGTFLREKGQWVAYSPFDPSGLQADIDALEADVAALDLELDGKAPLVHTHDQYAMQMPIDDGKLLSGFADNVNITVSYDSSNRRITLTHPSGSIRYHYRGKEKTLVSPWTSSAHSNTSGNWFLYSEDGDTFFWSNAAWKFEDVMVSYVRKGTNLTFALRETHGLMDPNAHRIAHANIGTYVVSGGTLTAGTYAIGGTASDASNTPGLDTTVISDEDILTTIPALAEGSYRAVYPVTATDFGFSDLARPFSVGASYIQWYNGTVATEGATGKYYVVYAIGLPTTADAASQLNRWLWTVPQKQYDTLAQAQASTLADVNLCDLTLGITEYIPRVKLIYGSNASYATTGKVRLEDATYLVKGTSATAVASETTTSWNNLADIPEAIAAIDNLPPSADKLAYYTGANTAALTTFTAFMRTLLDDADAATARATLGAGTVSSVALTATGPLSVGGSPITGSGTLALTWSGSSANLVRADGSVVASSSFQPAGSYAPAVAGGYLPLSGGTMAGHLLGGPSYNIGATASWWGSGFFTTLNVQNNPVWHSGNFTPGNYQPLDSDLTAIAALTTTAYGRGFLPLADAAAARTYIGAQVAGSYQPLDADLTAVAALTTTGFVRRTAADTWSASALVWSDIASGHPSVIAGTGLSGTGSIASNVTLSVAYGAAAGTACVGNDSRLSDARTPTAHVLDSATHTISGKTAGQVLLATGATAYAFTGISGDATLSGAGALTLASTITAAGPVGGAATVPVITYDSKGRLTAVTTAAITPAAIGAQVAGSYQPLEDQRLSTTNSPSFSGIMVGKGGDTSNYTLVAFNTERPWRLGKSGTGGSTQLHLMETSGNKTFAIGYSSDSLTLAHRVAEFGTHNSAGSGSFVALNAPVTVNGNLTATNLIRSGGTSSQFLKADGSVDSSSYQPSGNYVTLDTTQTITGAKSFTQDLTTSGYLTGQSGISTAGTVAVNGATVSSTTIGSWNTAVAQMHTHANKSFLDTINQNMGTTHSPSFSGLTIAGANKSISMSSGLYGSSDGTNVFATGTIAGDMVVLAGGSGRFAIAANTNVVAHFSGSMAKFLTSMSINQVVYTSSGSRTLDLSKVIHSFTLNQVSDVYTVPNGTVDGQFFIAKNLTTGGTITLTGAIQSVAAVLYQRTTNILTWNAANSTWY